MRRCAVSPEPPCRSWDSGAAPWLSLPRESWGSAQPGYLAPGWGGGGWQPRAVPVGVEGAPRASQIPPLPLGSCATAGSPVVSEAGTSRLSTRASRQPAGDLAHSPGGNGLSQLGTTWTPLGVGPSSSCPRAESQDAWPTTSRSAPGPRGASCFSGKDGGSPQAQPQGVEAGPRGPSAPWAPVYRAPEPGWGAGPGCGEG